jgi:hypothetical protein
MFSCIFSDDSLGYEYPFTLKVVQKDGLTCAWCPWHRWVYIKKKQPLSIFIPLVAGIITEIEFSDIFLSMK